MLETGELLLVSASALLVTLSFQYWVTRATPKEEEEGNNNNNNNNSIGNSKGRRRKSEKEERRLERRRESQVEEKYGANGVDIGLQVDHCCCERTRAEAKKEVERQKQEEVRRRQEEELRRGHEESEKEEKVDKLEREVERLRAVEAEVRIKLRGEEEEVARLEQLLGNQQQVLKSALARLFPTPTPITFCEEHLAHLRKRQWIGELEKTT